jgi:short-subunit dehydrogenase
MPSQLHDSDAPRTALITGASAGIGMALAREFGRHGYHLVLVARRTERLETLARELTAAHGIAVYIETADLAFPETPQKIFDALRSKNIDVDVLVNNAGYSGERRFAVSSLSAQRDFIEVMVTSVVTLTHLFLPGMLSRGYGRVLNVASLAAFVPGGPGFTLYSASKAFMLRFTESLHAELADTAVKICALCPGFTYTELHDIAGTRAAVSRMPKFMWKTAEEVAAAGYAQIMAGETVIIPGRINRMLAFFVTRVLPAHMARNFIGGLSRRNRAVKPT